MFTIFVNEKSYFVYFCRESRSLNFLLFLVLFSTLNRKFLGNYQTKLFKGKTTFISQLRKSSFKNIPCHDRINSETVLREKYRIVLGEYFPYLLKHYVSVCYDVQQITREKVKRGTSFLHK